MRALILLNGEGSDAAFLRSLATDCDFILCADGGYLHARRAGIAPDLLVGDLDSCPADLPEGLEVLRFPKEKDETDGEIAIKEALRRGADEIVMTCALGGRTDHELANLYLLVNHPAVCWIREPNVTICCVTRKMELCGKVGATVSLIPVTQAQVTLEGFYYPLQGHTLKVGTSLGMSNVVTASPARITIEAGKVFVFLHQIQTENRNPFLLPG